MSYYMGIDPGKTGSLALLNSETNDIQFFDWPKDNDMASYFNIVCTKLLVNVPEIKLAVLEKVHAMPGQGVTSMFNFGVNYGIWQAFLMLYDIPHLLVSPQTWQKNLIGKADGSTAKIKARIVAKRLFPNAEMNGPKGGWMDGRADAALIAHYASTLKG